MPSMASKQRHGKRDVVAWSPRRRLEETQAQPTPRGLGRCSGGHRDGQGEADVRRRRIMSIPLRMSLRPLDGPLFAYPPSASGDARPIAASKAIVAKIKAQHLESIVAAQNQADITTSPWVRDRAERALRVGQLEFVEMDQA